MPSAREWWWLVALEATLFLSISCWELTATWAEPLHYPLRFASIVLGGATLATLAFHIGPALLARRDLPRLPFLWLVVGLWLGLGYAERIVMTARMWIVMIDWSGTSRISVTALALAIILLALSCSRRAQRIATVSLLALGALLLLAGLATSWHGLRVQRTPFQEPLQLDRLLLKGILLSAAPAIVISWRIGRVAESARKIWISGFAGVWLPLTVAITIASVACQGGAALTPGGSLVRSSVSAFVGLKDLRPGVVLKSLALTLLGPALLSCVCLHELSAKWRGQHRFWLIPLAAALLTVAAAANQFVTEGFWSEFARPAYQTWVLTILILGAGAAIATLLFARPIHESR